jgi:hypothetical protein
MACCKFIFLQYLSTCLCDSSTLIFHRKGQYGQDIHTLRSIYINGHSPPIHMHWRRFKVSEIPLATAEDFNDWLQERWLEKDTLLSHYAEKGYFTSALARNEQIITEVRLGHLWELWSFGVILLLLTVTLSIVASSGKVQLALARISHSS